MSTSTPDVSNLAAAYSGSGPSTIPPAAPQMPQYDPSQEAQTNTDLSGPQSGGGGSRLKAILSAVANVASTGLAGVPDKGRPSVFSGLGEGARANQAAQANQQAIKMADFDSSVRLASLHAQDQELQLRTQAQQDALRAIASMGTGVAVRADLVQALARGDAATETDVLRAGHGSAVPRAAARHELLPHVRDPETDRPDDV